MKTDLPKSRFAAVNAVCKAVESDNGWDQSNGEAELHFHILRAAQTVGRFEPFREDEHALNEYLVNRMAGKRLCDYAWRMFSQKLAD